MPTIKPTGYPCIRCGKIFKRKDNLNTHHMRKIPCNSLTATSCECPNCHKIFANRINMVEHMVRVCLMKQELMNFGNNLKLYLKHINPPDFEVYDASHITMVACKGIMKYIPRFIKESFYNKYIKDVPFTERSIWRMDKNKHIYCIRQGGIWRHSIPTDAEDLLLKLFWDPISGQIKSSLSKMSKSNATTSGKPDHEQAGKATDCLTMLKDKRIFINILDDLRYHLFYKSHEFTLPRTESILYDYVNQDN